MTLPKFCYELAVYVETGSAGQGKVLSYRLIINVAGLALQWLMNTEDCSGHGISCPFSFVYLVCLFN